MVPDPQAALSLTSHLNQSFVALTFEAVRNSKNWGRRKFDMGYVLALVSKASHRSQDADPGGLDDWRGGVLEQGTLQETGRIGGPRDAMCRAVRCGCIRRRGEDCPHAAAR